MNIESEILKKHSKQQAVKISAWIGNDEKRFADLMKLFLAGEYSVAQRASWVMSHCAERHTSLITPWLSGMIKKASEHGVHDAVKRNVVRILQIVDIPNKLQGPVTNLCFGFLQSVDTPIAVKAFSMTVLANIAAVQPDLKRELSLVIEEMMPYAGPGILSRAKKVLHKISPYRSPRN